MRARRARFVALRLVALAACSADPRFRVFEADDASFRVHYLAPPWEVEESGAWFVRLRVPRVAERHSGGIPLPPVYALEARIETGTAEARARADARGAPSRGETVLVDPRPVDTDCGASGFETLTVDDDGIHHRFVSLGVPGGVLRLVFLAVHPLDDPEVSAMIDRVEVEASCE